LDAMLAKNNLENSQKDVSIPIWKITQEGTAKSVKWVDHAPNLRFAIYDPNDDSNPEIPTTCSDDLVLDKETGLVWARDANLLGSTITWEEANSYCWVEVTLGNRKGWRLPTVEELSSLVDPSQSGPALPMGHPFINVMQAAHYWSRTAAVSDSAYAWMVLMGIGNPMQVHKSDGYYIWPVRGGNGYATGSW